MASVGQGTAINRQTIQSQFPDHPEIIKLKEKIALAELKGHVWQAISGKIFPPVIAELLRLKSEIDDLYDRWAEGGLK